MRISGRLCMDRRGISPVVAMIVLVAVSVAASAAISFWLGDMVGTYTRFEKIEVVSAYAIRDIDMGHVGWSVNIILKNTGSADATIYDILINGKPLADYSGKVLVCSGGSTNTTVNFSIGVGEQVTITLYVMEGENFTSGASLEVRLYSADGQEYPRIISLP
ncbi:MAG: archaellin/type IV pilin N-terminal domain-containing protein [Candidatus Bathyarchaeia archaeon]